MRSHKKKSLKKSTAKVLLAGVLSFGSAAMAPSAFAQTPPPPPASPPAPPSPGEVFNKINPFKKKKNKGKDTVVKKDTAAVVRPGGPQTPPPPPPNPLNLFKKKKAPAPTPPPATSGT